jgi:carboxypeptidase family protein/TonB-dependent receptor-like protein
MVGPIVGSRRRVPFQVSFLFVAILSSPALAAAQATSGAISGVITDAQGAVLPGVALTLRNTDTGFLRTTATDADGRYRLAGLPPGRYELRTELSGFTSVEVTDITLTIALEVQRNITLQLGGVQESLTVTGEAAIVETTRTDVSGVITQQQIETLPLAARQPVALALLMPGTSQDAVRPRKFNVNVGAGGFTHATALLVDGMWNKEGNTGEPRMDLPQAAIREFKVYISQAPAEYGWTAGGVVSFETKSGTNLWSGEAFEYFRDKSLNTMNRFERERHDTRGTPKPDFRRNQFGAAVGGPIVRDRVHMFTTAERTKTNLFATVTTGRPEFYSALEGTFAIPEYSNMVFTRGDVQINPQQTAFGRYAWQDSDFTCEGCGGRLAIFSGSGIQQKRYSWVGGHTWVLSPRVLNEIRGQATNVHFRQHPPGVRPAENLFDNSTARTAPLTQIYNFPSLVWGANANAYSLQTQRQIRDDLSIAAGRHTWKVGGGYLRIPINGDVREVVGVWTFTFDQPFDPTNPAIMANLQGARLFTAVLRNIRRYIPNQYWDVYVQDEWKPVSTVTLSLGLRYEYQDKAFGQDLDLNDKEIFPTTGTNLQIPFVDFKRRGDKNNLGPRVGLAWNVNDGRSVVRAGYGIYYNPMNMFVTAGEWTNFRQPNINITNPSYPDPYQRLNPEAFASTAPQNIAISADDLENVQSQTSTVGFSQELSSALAIHVDGVYNRMTKIPLAVDINPRSGLTIGPRPLAQFARIDQNQSIGELTYKALMVRLDKRFDNRYMYLLSYTLAKSDGNLASPGISSRITQAEDPALDTGPAANDRRHVLVASGSVLLPYDVTLGGVWTLRSTMPFSAIAGRDLNGDALVTDYVPGTTRAIGTRDNARIVEAVNAWRVVNGLGPIGASQIDTNQYNAFDMRVSKSFSLGGNRKLELIGQVFNLFGSDNLDAAWNTNALSDSFGRILQAFNRQQAELAVRVAF